MEKFKSKMKQNIEHKQTTKSVVADEDIDFLQQDQADEPISMDSGDCNISVSLSG